MLLVALLELASFELGCLPQEDLSSYSRASGNRLANATPDAAIGAAGSDDAGPRDAGGGGFMATVETPRVPLDAGRSDAGDASIDAGSTRFTPDTSSPEDASVPNADAALIPAVP